MARAQILVVEDELVVAESIQSQLESLGYDVPAIVAFGDAAVEKAGEMRPDLVLMDIKLAGGMDGIEAAEQIHSRFDIPVVYLTAFADDETLRRAKITEPFGYILKPFQAQDLRISIEIALYKHQMESKLRASEERYRESVERSPNPIFSIDREGTILTWNQACLQFFRYEPQQVIGQTYHKLLWNSNDCAAIEAAVAQVWQGQSLSDQDIVYRSQDGTRLFTASRLYPLRDARGNIQECVLANTDVTEHRQAEEEIQRRTAQLEALREVGLKLTAELDLDALLHSIASSAVELLGGVRGSLYLYRPDRDILEWAVTTGDSPLPSAPPLHRGEGLAGKVWDTGKPLIVDDYRRWEGRAASYEGYPIGAVVAAPVRWGEEFLGVLDVLADPPRIFSPTDAELLSLFAAQAAIAIRNARLYEAEQKRVTQLTVVNQVARQAASILDPQPLLQGIVAAVQRGFGYYNVAILLLDENTDELKLSAIAGGFKDTAPSGYSQKVGTGMIGWTAATGQTLWANDVSQEPHYIPGFLGEHAASGSELCVPLKLAGHVVGVLDVQDTRPNIFDETDLTATETLADQVVVAIESARLYEQSQNRMQSLVNLNRASQILASSLDVKKVLDQIVNLAGSVVNSDYTSVVLSNADGQLTRQADDFRGVPPISQRIRREGTTRYVLNSGKPLVVDTISDEGVMSPSLRYPGQEPLKANPDIVAAGIRSFAAVPIQAKDKTMGVLFVHSRAPRAFYGQLPLLTTFANQAAVAIENAHLFQAQQEQRELSDALAEAAAAVNTLDLDQVLDRILEQVERIVAGDTFNVMLVENDIARLVRGRGYERVGKAEVKTAIAHLTVPISDYPNLSEMAKTGEPIFIPDTTADPNWIPGQGQDWRRSYVGAPIRMEGQTIGFLNVNGLRQGQFGPADARRLQVFANHIAAAVTNARLHQEVLDYAEQLEGRIRERTALIMAQYARLEAILHSTADGIITTDANGEILQVNPVARTWLTQSLSTKDAQQLQETVIGLAQRAAEQPRTVLELTDRDLELKAAPISKPDVEETFTPTQQEPAAVVAIHDISELKALDRLKTNFVKNASHELRTPITTIKLYAHLIQQTSPQDARWRQYMDALVQEVDDQARLGEDILQISRIYAGRTEQEMKRRAISLNDLTETVVIRNRSLAHKGKLTLEHRPAQPGPIVLADTEQMIQALNILVENAIRYTPEEGRIIVATGQHEIEGRTWAAAAISDTGERIPQEDMPHIFDRLFREGDEEPSSMRVRETGLRLMVVKEIVSLHEGQVVVESSKDTGTTFTVRLPLAD